jgi:multicomponent Na+:H+ antiporter subunit B
MIERHESVVVTTFVRVLIPPAQLFAFYVLVHGHDSPGGGFQAGVILASTYILLALGLGPAALTRRVNEPWWVAMAAAGVLLYVSVGVAGFAKAAFLDYGALSPGDPVHGHWVGILLIETGVTLTVASTLVVIFCRLATRKPIP